MATNLFEKVKELQDERKKQNQSMMDFMQSLDGYGQLGYGIGYGLAKLFSGDSKDTEMLQAEREDAYAKRVLMEQDPKMQQQLLEGAYALNADLGQNLESKLASEAASQMDALKTRMEMAKLKQDMAISLQDRQQKDAEFAIEQQRQFKAPSKDTLAAATQMAEGTDWEAMGYKQAPTKGQVIRMAGAMEAQVPPQQAMILAMGMPPSDAPIQDKWRDVRAKTDKQISNTNVTNPSSLSDPTEY